MIIAIFVRHGFLNILPAFNPCVRRFLGVRRYSPGAANHNNAGNTTLFAEDLDTAGGDPHLLRYFFNGKVFHKNLLGLGHTVALNIL